LAIKFLQKSLQALSHNVHQARAPKVLAVVRVVKRAGVLVTTAVRPRAVVVTQVVNHAPTHHAQTNHLQIVASVALPHAATSLSRLAVTNLLLHVAISRLQIVAKNLLPHAATNRLPRAVKNHTHHVVKNRMAIVATRHAVINRMPHAATILTPTRAPSHVRLSPALTAVPQIARPMQANPPAQHATLRHVLQHQAAKPLHHAVMLQRVRAHLAQVLHVPPRVHVAASPLTAVAVKL
jgi:hypothetical protein